MWRVEAALLPGGAGDLDDGRIASRRGESGVFAHGPYLALPPGGYRLDGELRLTGDGASPQILLEVVHQERLVAAIGLALPADQRSMGFCLPFRAPESAAAVAAAASWEFRFHTTGGAPVAIERLGVTTDDSAPAALSLSLLPLMQLGKGVEAVGGEIRGRGPGHVVFGPYRRLFPGDYEVRVAAQGPEGLLVTLEVVVDETVVQSLGARLTERGLRVSAPLRMASDDGPFEVRLHASDDRELTITELDLVLTRPHPVATPRGSGLPQAIRSPASA